MSKIDLRFDGHIARLQLNRPDKLNAIDREMLEQLAEAVARIDQSAEARVVIMGAAGQRAFCVGADINDWTALKPVDMWRRWIRAGHAVFESLARLRQPVIASLNGYTLGGGLELALAADIRLAAAGIELGFPEAGIATLPGWGGTQRLPALIGSARAKQMIFSAQRISAAQAERWSLVNEVVPMRRLHERAEELAGQIAANAPLAVQFAKQAIDSGGMRGGYTIEALAGALSAGSDDAAEGLASFRERRPPAYRGA